MASYTLEQHQAALAKAKAAGDDAGVATIQATIDSLSKAPAVSQDRHLAAYKKAAEAGDVEATDTIAASYRSGRKGWSRDAARKDPMWVSNAKTLHKEVEGKDFSGSDEDAAEWLKSYMSDFNYRLAGIDKSGGRGTLDIAAKVHKFSKAGKAAFIASLDDFDELPWMSGEGFKAAVGRGVTDLTNLVGVGTFGAGTVAKQGAQVAAKQGLKQALKYGLKQAGRGAAIGGIENAVSSGVQDVARQKTERDTGRRDSFDWKELGTSSATGGILGAGLGSVGGAVAARRIAKAANKIDVRNQQAAGRVAERIARLEEEGMNPKDIKQDSADGAVPIIKKMQKDLQVEITSRYKTLRDHLEPHKASSPQERKVRELAFKAIENAKNDVKGAVTRDELHAIDKLVGHTQEGQELINLVEEKVEVQRMDRRGARGGISKRTDILNPLADDGGRFGRLAQAAKAIATIGSAVNPFSAITLPTQAGVVIGGRAADALTGRRSLVNLFKKQNLGTAETPDFSHLPSQFEINRQAASQAQAMKIAQKEARQTEREQTRLDRQVSRERDRFSKDQAKQEARQIKEEERGIRQQELQSARAAKTAQREAERQARDAAKASKAEADSAAKAERDKFKMLQGAARGVQAMKKVAEAEKAKAEKAVTPATPKPSALKSALQASLAQAPKVDSDGKPVKSAYAYNAGVRRIIAMQNSAKAKASVATPEVKKIILDAISKLESRDFRGPKNHKKRLAVLAEAKAQGKTLEEREVIHKALQNLAEVFK